jgi:uncharacterized membrane protein YgcG
MLNGLIRTTPLFWTVILSTFGFGATDQPRPMPNTFVHDFARVISPEKKAEIQAKANQLKDQYKTEIAVVTVHSLQGEDSFDYSMRMARSWGIGSKDNETRGLLILVAIKDRKTAFRTSRHIEGEIPDGVTDEISRQMNAYFKKGDFGGGLSLGLDQVLARLKTVYEPPARNIASAEQGGGLGWLWLPIIGLPSAGVGLLALRSIKRKKKEGAYRKRAASIDKARRKAFPRLPSVPARSEADSDATIGSNATPHRPWAETAPSPDPSPSYDTGWSSSDSSSSSSYDSGSSSYDSGSSYSGGSDFGGGGSDSSW